MAKRDSVIKLQRQLYLATRALCIPGASGLDWVAGQALTAAKESCSEALLVDSGDEVSAGWALPATSRALDELRKLIEAEQRKVQELKRIREMVGIAASVVENEEIKEVM